MRKFLLRSARRTWQRSGLLVLRLTAAERHYLGSAYAADTPAAVDADEVLRDDHPELQALRQRYAQTAPALGRGRRWSLKTVANHVNLRQFRGDSPYMWHYRELPQLTRLKYFLFLQHVLQQAPPELLHRLGEDGAFGCWTFDYPGYPRISRDLLDSVNEIAFLDRHLQVLRRTGWRILDIGAGYGRLAHRFLQAQPQTADYCCVDAVPESTFLCRYYLHYRACMPPARVVAFDELDRDLADSQFDIAFNVHSFSECTREAVADWLRRLREMQVPWLFIVPNDGARLLSLEADGARLDFADLVAAAGYRQVAKEPVIADPAVRELLQIDDHFLLFRLGDAS